MKAVQAFLVTKARTKTVNCNSHKENYKDFMISDWNLAKVEEHFPFSDLRSFYCYIMNSGSISFNEFVQRSITDTLQRHESE